MNLNNKNILITGGTGSFGKSCINFIVKNFNPKKLAILSRDELKQFELSEDPILKKIKYLRFFLGDIRDKDRLEMAFKNIDLVIHAAALKQVPAAEYNPMEFVKTNIIGAENIIYASIANNVKKVVCLSTDKAVNPINLYGATKLASDKLFIAANNLSGKKTKFSVVRYGNVLGSRGSVIPFFKSFKSKNQKKIPITDFRMTRFFISLEDSVKFVLQSINLMDGGEIFIPKIPSVKITDLAKAIVPNCSFNLIGRRPGEKISEILLTKDEAINTIENKKCYIVTPQILENKKLKKYLIKNFKKVDKEFEYTSALNKELLSQHQIRNRCKKLGIL